MTIASTSTQTGTFKLFNMRPPYLGLGDHRAASELMTVKLKKYEQGGENRMHHHLGEDHCFVVLEGEATFHLGAVDGSEAEVHVIREYDGILLERGAFYWFENTGDVDLVLFRVGALDPSGPKHASFTDGSVKHGRKD
jgi:mannose-6-phosphate isomerase-like protein (cupin superfamily)